MSDNYKILILEDDSDFSDFLQKLLILKDFEVFVANRGYDALKYLNSNQVDLALLDVQLPDVDGYWIMDQVKKQFPDLLVIMMTGCGSIDSAVKALKKGAYDYLEKPFATEKLLKTIQNALDRKRLEIQGRKTLDKLGESEEKYHQLFDSVTDALMIFDAETRKFEDANAAALNLFGYSLEEFCNLQVEDISEEKDKTLNTVEKIKEGTQGSRFVPRRYLRRKDGSTFCGEISAATFISDGRNKIIGSIRDVSERERTMEELNATKNRLEHVLSSSPAVIYTADPAANFAATFVSDNVKTQLGYEPVEYTNDPKFWVDKIHPDDAPHMAEWISNLMEKGWQVSEYRFRHKDGGYRWLHDELKVIYDAQGAPKEVAGSSIDITARKKVETELQESEERYRQLFESESDSILVFDVETLQIEEVNRAALNQFGYSKPEILNKTILDLSAEKEKTFETIQAAKKAGCATNRIPLRYFRRKDGSVFPSEISASAFKSGERLKNISSIRDISSRIQAEKKLRNSKKRFRSLVENSLIGIAIIQNDKFVYQNQVQDTLYGPIQDKTIFQAYKFIHPDDFEKIKKAYEIVRSGKSETIETDFRFYPSGDIGSRSDLRWVQCRATPFNYRGKEAIMVNSLDITEAKQLEHQLIIKNKMLSLGRVAAGIAHEIRNPLTGINSYLFTLADLCRSDAIDSDDLEMMQQIVDQIQVASNKIESVIKRVMDFSKPGAPNKLSEATLRKNGIKLEKALNQQLPKCYVDLHLIEQVILNLITNAARAMENGNGSKKIEIKSYSKNNRVCIGVADSGPGVPLKDREKIFDPFFTTHEDGQGIGLNIAQRIIADHNGSLSLDTSKWSGAEFRIELPVEKRMDPR
jgi:PAS domain S-box-containing protein